MLLCVAAIVNDPWYQSLAGITVLFASFVAHNALRPYEKPLHNTLEAASFVALLATQVGSLLYLRAEGLHGAASPDIDVVNVAVTVALVLINGVFVSILAGLYIKAACLQRARKKTTNALHRAWAKPSYESHGDHDDHDDSGFEDVHAGLELKELPSTLHSAHINPLQAPSPHERSRRIASLAAPSQHQDDRAPIGHSSAVIVPQPKRPSRMPFISRPSSPPILRPPPPGGDDDDTAGPFDFNHAPFSNRVRKLLEQQQ